MSDTKQARQRAADERAYRIATNAAEEFVRCNGVPTDAHNEFVFFGADLADPYFKDCVEHLKWEGKCMAFEKDDCTVVILGDFTITDYRGDA